MDSRGRCAGARQLDPLEHARKPPPQARSEREHIAGAQRRNDWRRQGRGLDRHQRDPRERQFDRHGPQRGSRAHQYGHHQQGGCFQRPIPGRRYADCVQEGARHKCHGRREHLGSHRDDRVDH